MPRPKSSKGARKRQANSHTEAPAAKKPAAEIPAKISAKSGSSAMPSVSSVLKQLSVAYKSQGKAVTAAGAKKYMRNQFEFHGLYAAQRRAIDKKVAGGLKEPSMEFIHSLARACWQQEYRDYQLFCLDFMDRHKKVLRGANLADGKDSLTLVEELIRHKSWWDTVDMLASHCVGDLVLTYRQELSPVMDEWITDENLWIRRSAILHQLTYRTDTDVDTLFKYCLQCCHEKEFFIQKAIGWALRSYHYIDPKAVVKFVKDNDSKLAKLSKREALKHA